MFNFNFSVTHLTLCCACDNLNTHETFQLYIEIPVPPDNSPLNEYVEEYFNISELGGVHCEACQKFVEKEKRSKLTDTNEAEFITVILRRAIETMDGYELDKNTTIPTDDVFIRYLFDIRTNILLQ